MPAKIAHTGTRSTFDTSASVLQSGDQDMSHVLHMTRKRDEAQKLDLPQFINREEVNSESVGLQLSLRKRNEVVCSGRCNSRHSLLAFILMQHCNKNKRVKSSRSNQVVHMPVRDV